jgi:hypothetical protein
MRKRVNECSIALHALTFVRAVGIIPLGVDNRRHWMLDVIFHEGFARFGTGDGPNMATIRQTALNLLSRARPTISIKNRHKMRLQRPRRPLDIVPRVR